MVSRTTIVIATTNRGKKREMQAMLAGLPVELATPDDYPAAPDPIEDADTFDGNATIKALHYAHLAGAWALADDSGLEVDALGRRPGVHSSRYAGPDGDAAANNAKLVSQLAGVSSTKRTARFRCVVVLASESKVLATASGTLEGLIIDEPRGHSAGGTRVSLNKSHFKRIAQANCEARISSSILVHTDAPDWLNKSSSWTAIR